MVFTTVGIEKAVKFRLHFILFLFHSWWDTGNPSCFYWFHSKFFNHWVKLSNIVLISQVLNGSFSSPLSLLELAFMRKNIQICTSFCYFFPTQRQSQCPPSHRHRVHQFQDNCTDWIIDTPSLTLTVDTQRWWVSHSSLRLNRLSWYHRLCFSLKGKSLKRLIETHIRPWFEVPAENDAMTLTYPPSLHYFVSMIAMCVWISRVCEIFAVVIREYLCLMHWVILLTHMWALQKY
jgi:hypothetical protein